MTRRRGVLEGTTLTRRSVLALGALGATALATYSTRSCATGDSTSGPYAKKALGTNPSDLSKLAIDNAAWSYDSKSDVYYQTGIQYCASPAATSYENMAVYVPGGYLSGTRNDDGKTYTCKVRDSAAVGGYTSANAPVVIPIDTPGYVAQKPPTSYDADGLSKYLEAGIVYVWPGCRGRNNGTNPDGSTFAGGAPWGVTDLKAAIRCLGYNASRIPGGASRVFAFGMSGSGGQCAVVGATGDSELYAPYLESIGAVFSASDGTTISDAIAGAMCWCPITALGIADETWIRYDSAKNTATITSVGAFVRHCKHASKGVGAFDALDCNQNENYLFGNATADSLHFDSIMASLLASEKDSYATCSDYGPSYAGAYAADMNNADDLGTRTATRQRMYNPMYFVAKRLGGYGKATAAEHWRIRTGIRQGDTSLTTELNLALALRANPTVSDVDFATVWDKAHTTAERRGSSTANFIAGVGRCCG